MTISDWRDGHYGRMADQQSRTFHSEGAYGRAANVTKGFDRWRRFNSDEELTWVNDVDGVPRALTPKQLAVYLEMRELADSSTTLRAIALRLKLSPSTVSRAAVKLASFGLIAFLIGRGRYGGILIYRRLGKNDGLEAFRKAAIAKVREWSKAAEKRLLRTKINVASRYSWKEIADHGYATVYVDVVNATLKRPWTAEDMAEIV